MATTFSDSKINLETVEFDPFAAGELAAVVPATEPQREVWLAAQMGEQANCAYNESLLLRLRGELNLEALTVALQQLVQRHDALRASFSPDGVSLCIANEMTIDIPVIDLTAADDRQSQIEQLRIQAVTQPFDLLHGPLFRATIVRCDAAEHLVILTGHHVVCDGWSWGVLLPDLGALYSAAKHQTIADLEAPEQFIDFAQLQNQQALSAEFAVAEQFWLSQFSGEIPVLDFPLDRPRPPQKTYVARREDWQLEASLPTSLKRVAAKSGCTLLTILLTAFEVFLHRLTGQEEIVVGTPAAGQSFFGVPNLVGHCVNLLPLRSKVRGNQSFLDYLKARNPEILDAYEHQQITFGSLVKQLAIPRDRSRVPLISVLFNYDRALLSKDFPFDGLETELFSNPRYAETFDLFINATDTAGKVVLECQYNTDLFDAATIRRRMAEFETLLAGIVADPTQSIAHLPLLPVAEQDLLKSWNATQADYPAATCVHELFEAQVERTPEAVAVVFGDQTLTFQQLNQQANQLAHALRSLGVAPEVMVGICVERSLEMVVGLLGILKAGGAYVPLDPAHPADRIAYVLEDTAASIILTQTSLLEVLPQTTAQMVCLDRDKDAIAQNSGKNPTSGVSAQNLAYVIYTSGSTGRPKGVQIEHRSAVNLLNFVRTQPGLTAADTLLAVATITFDISVAEIFLPLAVGAKLVIASREVAIDGRQLIELLETSGTTFLQPTPATWQLLLASGWQGDPHLKMISTGEALSRELANQLLPKGGELWNLYGPTETTIWSSTYLVMSETGCVAIGRPLANTQFHILDAQLQPVPIGVAGELYIGGDGLARGYLNRPELTAERFISDPFSPQPGDRLYKTGDLARYLPDGTVECLGRLDYQVKVRGFRIELGEIESLLLTHPDVLEAVVVAREDTPNNKRLVAYIVPQVGQNPVSAELKSFINRELPEYMLPSAFVVMEQFPLTSSGKVNRKALPEPEFERAEDEDSFVAPRNSIEIELAQIWEKVLGITPIGMTDNFFELGGHSLLAARLLLETENAFNQKLPLATIFQASTIEQFALILTDSSEWQPSHPSMVVIQPGTSDMPLFAIHVLGRGLAFYRPLVKYLEPSQTVIGLSVQIMEAEKAPANRTEDLAAYYIQAMRSLQPEGPYLLSGVSFGGVVAFEMAQQLRAQGQEVALLALLDTYSAVVKKLPPLQRIGRLIMLLRIGRVDVFLQKISLFMLSGIEKLGRGIKQIRRSFYRGDNQAVPVHLQDFTYQMENDQALDLYTPQPYPGAITFFKSSDRLTYEFEPETANPEVGWRTLARGKMEVFDIPGDHLGMLEEPNVQVLGENLKACLAQVQVLDLK